MSESQPSNHNGSFAIIPSYIMEDCDLCEGAKILYARISMYADNGRCWASNEHLADKQNVEVRSIQRWLKQLKDKKYIIIDVEVIGLRQTKRDIWLSEDFKNKFKPCQKRHPPLTKKTPPPDKKDTHIRTSDNNKKNKQQQQVANAPVVVSSPEENKREEDADAAATQYINSELKKGNKVNESRIRKQALKEGWKPNQVLGKNDMLDQFKHGQIVRGSRGRYECVKDELGIGFMPLDFSAPQNYTAYFNSKTFKEDLKHILRKLA